MTFDGKSTKLSVGLKTYKTLYGFIKPLLGVFAVICAILCCFRSAEGSNSRLIVAILLGVAVIIRMIMEFIHKRLDQSNMGYHIYVSKVVRKLEPENIIPLCVMTIVILVPFWVLIVTSIKTPIEANQLEFTWWPKQGIDFNSYKELFYYGDAIGITMARAVVNSFVYAFIPTFIGILVSALSAYAFAKMRFRGRDTLYSMLIATMMMPGCVTLATSYLMYDWYGWAGTALPLIVPGIFGGASTVMFLREYFMGVPDGLLEAARIDGAGRWRIFLQIMLPLGKPALIAQFVLGFITRYNDYMGPLIYLNVPSGYTIQVAISFLNGVVADNSLLAAAGVFALAPMLLLYVIFQKPILEGISMSSGLKG